MNIEIKCSGQSDAPHREVVEALFEGVKKALSEAGLAYEPSYNIHELKQTRQAVQFPSGENFPYAGSEPWSYSEFFLSTAVHKNADQPTAPAENSAPTEELNKAYEGDCDCAEEDAPDSNS